LFCVASATAGKWDDAPSDVEVRATIATSPTAVHATVSDLKTWSTLLPEDCATDWQFTASTRGVGSKAKVTYTYGPLRRKLTANIVSDEPGRLWRIDHENERKGFFVQFSYPDSTESSTNVLLATPLNPPPWPFKGPFYKKVRPAWEDCYTRSLQALSAAVPQ
jgi:hypothetical protein